MTDKLPPEVAEALGTLGAHFTGMHGIHLRAEWACVRNHLGRLTDENARLRDEVECDEKRVLDAMDTIHEQDQAISVAEAERDEWRAKYNLAITEWTDDLRGHIDKIEAERDALREDKAALNAQCQQHFLQAMKNGQAAIDAGAERDALKARIAGAGKAACCNDGGLVGPSLIAYMADEDIGKVFALVKLEDAAHD